MSFGHDNVRIEHRAKLEGQGYLRIVDKWFYRNLVEQV